MQLKIDPVLKALIPPLTAEELRLLEYSLLEEGCRDSLITWNDTIIDGHNRFEICNKHGIPYRTEDRDFESIEDVKVWMIDNQNARRNLTDGWKYDLAQARKQILIHKGKEKQGHGKTAPGTTLMSTIDRSDTHSTRNEIANELGWSTGKVAMADVVWKQADEQVKEKVKAGEVSINEAYKNVKQEQKKAQKEQIRNELANEGSKKKIDIDLRHGDFMEVFADLRDGSIDCIITDPPYPHQYINEWSKLSKFSKRVLKPNGYCIAYSGQMYLPEVMNRMSEHLDYYWTFAVYHEGNTQIVNGVNLMCRWKPVLIFQNGKKKIKNTFQDYFISEAREKDGHDWQQSQSGVAYLVEMFTKQNDKVLDPFAGSGTTLIVAKNKARIALGAEVDEQTYNIAKALL